MVSTNLSKSSLTKLTFDPTRAGIKVFKLKFRVAIGTTLAKDAQTNEDYDPTDTKELKAHGEIFDYLLSTMTDDVLILEMITECGELGPKCLKFLDDKYDPASTATSLKTLLNIMKAPLGDNISIGISAAVVSNANLPTGLQFPDKLLCALLLLKLPTQFNHLKSIIVERDELPTVAQLKIKVTSSVELFENSLGDRLGSEEKASFLTANNYTRKSSCVNCDKDGHKNFECTLPKASCTYCGVEAGHMSKHCFVPNDRPYPFNMSQEKKDKFTKLRAEYQAKHQKTSAAAVCMRADDDMLANVDDDFWDSLNFRK
jgi:hypothetical protein